MKNSQTMDPYALTPEQQDILDELVYQAASSMASNANNGGKEEQYLFLVMAGWSRHEVDNTIGLKTVTAMEYR